MDAARMESDEVSVSDTFERFIEATTMKNVITLHKKILDYADLAPCEFNNFFPRYKRAVTSNRQKKNWKAKALFSKIEKRANHKCYSNTKATATTTSTPPMSNRTSDNVQASTTSTTTTTTTATTTTTNAEISCLDDSLPSQLSNRVHSTNNNALHKYKCLIIGSGPAGLRTAIELQLLGAERVVVVEKRSRFSRNNVLHLWPFVIDDLKSLGAKKFYGKFCAGSIDHISIRQLQLILLKVCLMIGCDFRDSCSYISLCPSSIKQPDAKRLSATSGESEDKIAGCAYAKCQEFVAEQLHQQQIQQQLEADEAAPRAADDIDHQEHQCLNGESHETNGAGEANAECAPATTGHVFSLQGASAHFESDHARTEEQLHSFRWDIVVGADGRRNTLKNFFPRKEFRGRLAIAITANFINRQTPAEACVPEISGLSFIYNQDMFNALAYDTGIQLENICYYKDDTHYFVMTAKKKSLLERGVLISDYAATQDLLSDRNVNKEALLKYAKDAAYWTTGLEPLDFALNHYGQEDCAMFDFTSMYAASNACKALRTSGGGLALVSLVGDSLLEPFWPTGSGCARGFLSSFDAAWMCRQWAVNKCATLDYHGPISTARSSRNRNTGSSQASPGKHSSASMALTERMTTYDKMALSVIAERESIYRILAQTTSENLQQNYAHWTLNPHTRYPNLNRHLILPNQVEHLIADASKPASVDSANLLSPGSQRGRRVKSPSSAKSRRSPKKLKSAGASPLAQARNVKNRAKSMPKRSKSRHDVSYADYYLELEESYRNLADTERGGMTQYLSYRRRDSTDLDDLFIPSISGTLPSSNNLSKLEARKARDIDECLRQRRQKTKITIVRDQLISRMRGGDDDDDNTNKGGASGKPLFRGGNAALFNEIKRMREQQARGASVGVRGDSKPRDSLASGPLSILNSMRRCASFAERVKSFESKLSSANGAGDSCDSAASTPRTPIDNVKNLPQFATLQELIVNSSQRTAQDQTGKSRIPVAKLAKDDWNVKCWENRFEAANQKYLSTSSRSLNKAVSVDSYCGRGESARSSKPKKQVDVFQDRINQMADKLKTVTDKQSSHQPSGNKWRAPTLGCQAPAGAANRPVRSQGWVNHLKRELAKGSDSAKRALGPGQPMNPVVPNKPIKKLFPDEDDDDDGIDVNKHYDHLCVNRPTNKYLTRGGYKSHLARPNAASTKIIDRSKLDAENKQAHIAALTSRGSSASSTLSDYSTNTGHSSSGASNGKQAAAPALAVTTITGKGLIVDVDCFRCRKFVSTADRITIGASLLHRSCLTCANCGITLRSNEIQHYMKTVKLMIARGKQVPVAQEEIKFVCAICQPEIRAALSREGASLLAEATSSDREEEEEEEEEEEGNEDEENEACKQRPSFELSQRPRMQSREEFLNSRINYSELYKNILADRSNLPSAQAKTDHTGDGGLDGGPARAEPETPPAADGDRESRPADVTLSPVQVTIAMKLVGDGTDNQDHAEGREKFSIAESKTAVDGSEQVTLILPSESAPVTPSNGEPDETLCATVSADTGTRCQQRKEMIDEEELQRILHLDQHQSSRRSSCSSSASSSSPSSSSSSSRSRSQTVGEASSARGSDREGPASRDGTHTGSLGAGGKSASAANAQQGARGGSLCGPGAREAASSSGDDDSSSLSVPPDSDEYDDNEDEEEEREQDQEGDDEEEYEDNVDMNSTCDDFITTEEFDATSDREPDENPLSEVSSGSRRLAHAEPREHRNKSADLPAAS